MEILLNDLNNAQKEAVTHEKGPLMIIAGAGSGKTRVLTYRIAWLISQGVDPFNILALTFTNKAALEMRIRIEELIGTQARSLWMGTFHSVFAKILRIEGHVMGYTSSFTIYDTDDSKSLLRTIIKDLKLDDKIYKVNNVLSRISNAKNSLVSWESYLQNPVLMEEDLAMRMPEIGNIYKNYSLRCFGANAMDFDDLLFNTNVLFRDHLDILHKYQHKFKHVLVDEFQDTNISQYLLTRKLAAVNQNICVVGDDAQSIYAFRGANIQNILNFKQDYPELVTVKLEQNYRSTQNIVNAANSLIKNNKNQIDKKVFTENDEGSKIQVIKLASDVEEGKNTANAIYEAKVRDGLKNTDFAILYRTNAQSRAMEEALRKINIKYRIIGGMSFYQRKEVKDLLSYLRFVVNPKDTEAFRRIINFPKRGIGNTTLAKISVIASENDKSIWEVLNHISHYLSGKQEKSIHDFVALIKSFQIMLEEGKDAYVVAKHVAKATGILRELNEDKTVEGLSRLENIQELLNSVKQFVDSDENEEKSLNAFLQTVSLLTNADQEDEDGDEDRVTLMTIHGAKGLEFKRVFVVGMEENLFPSQMMLSSKEDLEEERRLFYVAITRAKEKLTLSHAESRYNYGRLTFCEPSRFLNEIDPVYLDFGVNQQAIANSEPRSFLSDKLKDFENPVRSAKNFRPLRGPSPKHKATEGFVASDTSKLKVGDEVEHPIFGFGKVKKIDRSGASVKATVQFENHGLKTLLLSFAKLRIID